jgi:dCMP deaminase
MFLIFESPNKSGKTTLARMIADYLNIQYVKLNNINVVEDTAIKDGISISTHSQLETITQLHEKGVMKDVVLDRFHVSEFVYKNLLGRTYDISYIDDIEKRLSKYNDILLVRCRTSLPVLKDRWYDEKLIPTQKVTEESRLYNYFYTKTKLPVIEIDTDGSVEKAFAELVSKLELHGVSQKYFRQRRITHDQAMMNVAKIMAKRSPCLTRQVGCVMTEDGFVVGVGYNGPPSGLKHDQVDIRKAKGFKSGEGLDFSRDVHAEQNAMQQSGVRSKRAGKLELFTTASPCIHCMRQCIQIGIERIVYIEKYNQPLAWEMAEEAGIEMIQYEE